MSSDEASSEVTYTSISSDYEEPSDVDSPGAALLSDYVSEPKYPKYLDLSDEEVLVKDLPYDAVDSPIALSLGYIANLDPEDESEDGPTDYSADGGDDDDDSLGDDADEEEASEEDKEEGEEHLALADSTAVASPIVDHVPSAEEIDPFETDESAVTPPPPAYRTTARMSIQAQTPIPFPSEAEVDRLLAILTPPPSPLTSLSSSLPQIPSTSFLVPSPHTTSPTCTKASLGYRAAEIRLKTTSPPPLSLSSPLPLPPPIIIPRTRAFMVMMRATVPSTYCLAPLLGTPPLLHIPLPTSSPPLLLTSTDCKADVYEVMLRLCIAPDLDMRSGRAHLLPLLGLLEALEQIMIPATDVAEMGQRMTNFVTTVRQDTNEIYMRLGDAQDYRSAMSGQLNLLHRDRHFHTRTARLMESKAKVSGEAWTQSMDASDMTRSEKMPPRKAPRTRTSPTTATATTTTSMTDAAIRALIS
nr:hypothetical protein [Tanacetum cinerariifolium]